MTDENLKAEAERLSEKCAKLEAHVVSLEKRADLVFERLQADAELLSGQQRIIENLTETIRFLVSKEAPSPKPKPRTRTRKKKAADD